MGIRMSNRNSKKLENLNTIYRVKPKEIEMLKKVWEAIESDLEYFGSTFGKTLFHNHPEYMKYFQYDIIPQFVQDVKIKRKFSSVCGIMSSLILDYFNKPDQRDYILGFIAMIHKDMQLTLRDLENFLSDFLEMLLSELPTLMTAEHIVTQMNYFGGLMNRMNYLMIIYRENDLESDYKYDYIFQIPCGWYKNYHPMIYGRPLEYWESRKLYWHTRMALWLTMGTDLPNATNAILIQRKLQEINSDNQKVRKETRGIKKAMSYPQTSSSATTTSSMSPGARSDIIYGFLPAAALIKYRRRRSNERVLRKHSKTSGLISQMETISENIYESEEEYNANKTLRRGSIKKTEAFIHALKALKSARQNSDSDHFSSLKVEEDGKTEKTARERRRMVILQQISESMNVGSPKNSSSGKKDVGTSIRE